PFVALALGNGFAHNAFLEEMKLARQRIRLLLDGSKEEGMQIRVFLFDLAGDLAEVRLPLPGTPPKYDGPNDCGGHQDGNGQAVRPTLFGQQDQAKSNHGHNRPTQGQAAAEHQAAMTAYDRIELIFEERLNHVQCLPALNYLHCGREKGNKENVKNSGG